jgi:hypothetical protein
MKTLMKTAFGNASALASMVLLGLLVASSLTLAQTQPIIPVPKRLAPAPLKAAAPKPAVAPAKPVAARSAKQLSPAARTASSKVNPAIGSASGASAASTSQSAQPGASAVPSALSQATPSSFATPSNAPTSAGSNPGDPRTPVAGQGLGTFLWPGGWTLTAYGCFRTGTRLFCDFDTTNQNNLPANTSIWAGAGGVNLVDDGGKITLRHNAFFVGDDGSQFSTAYLTAQKPARFIIEYDNVDQRYTSISLVCGRDQIQGLPITQMDPSQPAGTIPARASASAVQRH